VRVLLAGSARARAHDIVRAAPRKTGPNLNRAPTGAARRHGLLPPTVLACACPAYPESRLASRYEREQPTSERLQAATPWQPKASESVLLRAEMPRLLPARCIPYLPRLGLGLRIVSRASVPPRLHQYPNTRCQCPGPAKLSLRFAPYSQFPVAHRPSVPCWLAGVLWSRSQLEVKRDSEQVARVSRVETKVAGLHPAIPDSDQSPV
jgi:hypothetical protein